MAIKDLHLKKFSVKELKKIMRENGIKGLTGKKNSLIERIVSSPNWETIKLDLSVPIKVYSAKQLANQQRFSNMSRSKKVKKVLPPKPDKVAEERDNKVEEEEKVEPKLLAPIKSIIDKIVLKKKVDNEELPLEEVIEEVEEIVKQEMGIKQINGVLREIIKLLIKRQ